MNDLEPIDRSIFADPDFRRDQLKDASSCPSCKYPDPVRLGVGNDGKYGCSECTDYPRCWLCRRWTFGDELIVSMDGAIRGICSVCFERGEEGIRIPLDMTEDDDA